MEPFGVNSRVQHEDAVVYESTDHSVTETGRVVEIHERLVCVMCQLRLEKATAVAVDAATSVNELNTKRTGKWVSPDAYKVLTVSAIRDAQPGACTCITHLTALKKDGTLRICGDFKVTLNQICRAEQYPVPKFKNSLMLC